MFASSNAVRFGTSLFISEGMYLTTDGGTTWFGSDTTSSAPITSHSGDPAPAIGPNGHLYQSYIISNGMGATVSTNMGATWANTTTLVTGSQDKNHTFVNDVPGSPYYGRVYVTWSLFTASAPPCVVSYSTNNGSTWSGVVTVNTPPSNHYAQGVNGTVGPNGDAYICWQSPITASPYTGDYVGFAKSTNGGVTWTTNNNIYDCNGIRGTITQKGNLRVNDFPWMGVDKTGGARSGWIYIVTAEKNLSPAGSDPDIVLHRSTDGGTTWSAGIRVNQDVLNNGKIQYMPAICVDEGGGVNVVYYDDRTTTSDSATVFVSRSTDGGTTWTDIEVSDHHFKPQPISGLATGYQGDYIGITSGNGKLWPYWCDPSTGMYQAWTTGVTLSTDFGWVRGTVTSGGNPLAGVVVDFSPANNQIAATTTANGSFLAGAIVPQPNPTLGYTLNARKFGYLDYSGSVTLTRGDTITHNIAMTPAPAGTLNVHVFKNGGSAVTANITVKLSGSTVASGTSDGISGIYATSLPTGSYEVTIDPPSPYGTRVYNATINASQTTTLDVNVRYVAEPSFLALVDTMEQNLTRTRTLALTNTTSDAVPFIIYDDNALARLRPQAAQPNSPPIVLPTQPKGDHDTATGDSPTGAGGPDSFGYRWIDSDEPGGPTFAWVDISSLGTQITSWTGTSDDGYATVTLPWQFPFYGNSYTTAQIGTNGFLSFTSTSTEYTNAAIPSAAEPNNTIYTFWDDLNFGTRGTVRYYNDAANSRFIIQYTGVPRYSTSGDSLTFQTILTPNGNITAQYLRMTGTLNSATIGLENANGTIALQVLYNAAYVHNNLAILFALPNATWLSESPSSGTIPANGTQTIDVTLNSTGLLENTTHLASLIIRATHPDVTSDVNVPVTLRIPPIAVPIQLASFTGRATETNAVQLDWTTVSETHNYGFEIQKASALRGEFQTILGSFVPGHGTTLTPQHYQWLDQNASQQYSFYRLKQIDLDGTAHYFEPIQVHILTDVKDNSLPTEFSLAQNYPNPFNPTTIIKYALPQNVHVTLEVFNSLGQRVDVLVDGVETAGYHQKNFHGHAVASGVYIYKLTAGNFVESRKLLLMK